MSCVLDGEIVCLDRDGRSNFYKLLFRRDWPCFYTFDVLSIDGEDLRDRPLAERKRRLRGIMRELSPDCCTSTICAPAAWTCSERHAPATLRASSPSGATADTKPTGSRRPG